jgi:hypothetical protein
MSKEGQIVIYNEDAASSPFIKIMIPATAVTAATLVGGITYTATNTSINLLSTATELGINGAGFVVSKATGALVSPIVGTSIGLSTGIAASVVKESIQSKAKLISLATSSVAGISAAMTVTALSYGASAISGLYSLGCSTANSLQNWVRSSEYARADISSNKSEQHIWMPTDENRYSPSLYSDVIAIDESTSSLETPVHPHEFIQEIESMLNNNFAEPPSINKK